ncbi:MAG TPA: hypothetical protein VEZ15_00230 [Acidimicrobiia bacterium]|nr:hypothetical protein [Acidimicrobiia bacterium]
MFEALLRRLTRTGLRRGMSGSRGWLVLGIVTGGLRIVRRLARDEEEVLYRTAIKPGDTFEILARRRAE